MEIFGRLGRLVGWRPHLTHLLARLPSRVPSLPPSSSVIARFCFPSSGSGFLNLNFDRNKILIYKQIAKLLTY